MASPKTTQPNATFVERANMDLQVQTNVAEEVAKLAASLGITLKGKPNEYEPDLFIRAVANIRDQLMEAKTMLAAQNERQAERERELEERESAIIFREKRVEAMVKLLGDEPKKSTFLSRLFDR